MKTIRVLLASNFALLREGLRALLVNRDNIEVIGEGSAGDAIARARAMRPDVLIVDVPPNNAELLGAIASMREEMPDTQVIALSAASDDELALRLLRVGVHGYLSEHEAATELVSAVNAVALGEVFLCPSASGVLLDKYREQSQARRRAALTPRKSAIWKASQRGA